MLAPEFKVRFGMLTFSRLAAPPVRVASYRAWGMSGVVSRLWVSHGVLAVSGV